MDSEDPDADPDEPQTSNEADSLWLKHLFTFVSQQVYPVLSESAPSDGHTPPTGLCALNEHLVDVIRRKSPIRHTLPVSYRPISVADLVSQQHLPCVSNLSWCTNQHRAWVREAELGVPGGQALPRVHLLLIGCLKEGRDQTLMLTDASGSVRCQCLSPSPLWLGCPVLLPHWNYIPHDASGHGDGWVELIGSPDPLWPVGPIGGAELSPAVGVREAAAFLLNRGRGQRLSVFGQVSSVCPLLDVGGTTFFIFSLTDSIDTLPVIVKDRCRWWWAERLRVGQSVCVTALRVCVMRGWRGNNILCVSDRSQLHTDYTQMHDPPPPARHHDNHATEEGVFDQSGVRVKRSRVISYQGTVTEVISEGAGLYVIDRKVGLCLAYQPPLKRNLRAGDQVELHHVHFLYRLCPDFPPSMLCTCLRSTLTVTAFSRVGGVSADSASTCPGDGVLPRLLLEKNMGVAEYLWACHLSRQLRLSLLPGVLSQQCVCLLSWKLLESVWKRGRRRGRRDIYSEMLDQPHTCPLSQYPVDPSVHQYLSVSQLSQSLRSDCWTSMSLQSLLPPGGSSLTRSEINAVLSWSYGTLSSNVHDDSQTGDDVRRRPLVLVGVLELPSEACGYGHALQLRDKTGVVSCVVTETDQEDGRQTAVFNTAWIGCLVCVHHFTMVTERFLQSEFPSSQHLDQDEFITDRRCRVYLQFSLDRVHILSPSVAMVTHMRPEGVGPGGDVIKGQRSVAKKRRVEEEQARKAPPCVSMVIWVEHKEGMAWKNNGAGHRDEEAGLVLGFSVRAAVIGPVVSWGRDPKNEPVTEREAELKKTDKVMLVFSGAALRWFPVLQCGHYYRLVAMDTEDCTVLIGCSVSGQTEAELQIASTLLVRSDWRFHTVTRPQDLLSQWSRTASVLSIADVLDSRSPDLVCFQALVCDRINLNDRTNNTQNTGVRLTVCDGGGRSLHVYLDLCHAPYTPGLLPGNSVVLRSCRRRVSRSGSVYVSVVPVSSVSVVALNPDSSVQMPTPPIMHLGLWALSKEHSGCGVGRVKGHVVCFLYVQLQWSCSLCGRVFTQSCSSAQCRSSSSVFQSKAKTVFDDGSAEAHVWFFSPLVQPLLRLDHSQWEGLQRALKVRGHVTIYPWGRSLISDPDSADPLFSFLSYVCSSVVVCRPLRLTCRKLSDQRSEEVKRFSRGDRDFMTRMSRPLQLTCTHLDSD